MSIWQQNFLCQEFERILASCKYVAFSTIGICVSVGINTNFLYFEESMYEMYKALMCM